MAQETSFMKSTSLSLSAVVALALSGAGSLAQAQVIRFWSGVEGSLPDHQPVIGPGTRHAQLLQEFAWRSAADLLEAPHEGRDLALRQQRSVNGRQAISRNQCIAVRRFDPGNVSVNAPNPRRCVEAQNPMSWAKVVRVAQRSEYTFGRVSPAIKAPGVEFSPTRQQRI